jgi:hypothetical protein
VDKKTATTEYGWHKTNTFHHNKGKRLMKKGFMTTSVIVLFVAMLFAWTTPPAAAETYFEVRAGVEPGDAATYTDDWIGALALGTDVTESTRFEIQYMRDAKFGTDMFGAVAYHDFYAGSAATPYVGIGGGALVDISGFEFDQIVGELVAGVSLNSHVYSLTFGYTHMIGFDDYNRSAVMVGVRRKF